MKRIKGHALRRQGAAFRFNERGQMVRTQWRVSVEGTGRALCECGAYSPVYTNVTQRRAWHICHKADVRLAEIEANA